VPEGVSRSQLAVYAALAVAVVVLGARYLRGSPPPAPASPAASAPVRVEGGGGTAAGKATVHVAGAVRRPGVYRLKPAARVDDALRLAGGPTRRADLSAVNLAAKVEDGRQILVPERAPRGTAPASGAGAAGGAGGAGAATPPAAPVNLNTATLEQLDTLDGIGPTLAQAILDFREENGGFGSVDDLAQVPGIGEKRMASLREQVTV
jgi:competence protein ComEA